MPMYFTNVLLLWSLCVALRSDEVSEVSQPASFQTAKPGDPVTIKCYIKSAMKKRVWYKLSTGSRLKLVAEMDSRYNRSVFPHEFRARYRVKFDRINSHLGISATVREDAGTYFCGVINLNNIEFGSGTFLMLKGANAVGNAVVQHPAHKSVTPGESVTLGCSVHGHHCPAEDTGVVWLKSSDHSAPEIIRPPTSRSNSCQTTENQETSCVYYLFIGNIRSEDVGTYHCALTGCGQVQFGNGTRIINTEMANIILTPAVTALMLSNVILVLVTLILVWALRVSWRKKSTEADGCHGGNQASDAVIYTTVRLPPRSLHLRQDAANDSEDPVAYSKIRDFHRTQNHVSDPDTF